MSNSLYHIHAIQVVNDQPEVASQLVLFLENKAVLTQDLPAISTQATNYSRRCIDACDFVIMIIGESYGAPNPSGVSQLHLSYLTAKTKDKPMLILLKAQGSSTRSRQLINFISTIEKDKPQHLYYYADNNDFDKVLAEGFETITAEVQQKAWLQLNQSLGSPQLKGLPSKFNVYSDSAHPFATTQADESGAKNNSKKVHKLFAKTGLSFADSSQRTSGLVKSIKDAAAERNKSGWSNNSHQQDDLNVSTQLSEASIEAIINQSLSDEFDLVEVEKYAAQIPHLVSLDDITTLSYDAHAYQDGNLSDVTLTASVSWRQLLKTLSKMGKNFSSDTMYRSFNDEVAHSAMQSVVKLLPNVHAVSRCMIEPRDFAWVKEQMRFNGWLESIEIYEHSNREFWRLTDNALTELGKKH